MLGQDPVADIKSRLQIEDVVRPYVALKKSGRSFKGLCPFHSEKTPSFHVSPERQLAYCFGCNKGGDLFAFIQEVEHVDFKGALELLADRAGVDLSHYASAPTTTRLTKDRREEFYHINDEAVRFFQDQLWKTSEGKSVLMYLEERGMLPETTQQFKVGFAPQSFDATLEYLVQKKCSLKDLFEVGLVVSKDAAADRFYDKFRNRLMFPIFDAQGRCVGFGGRALSDEDQPKYLNSPESPVYHKGEVLYGFSRAKEAIRKLDSAVVVEGYMDVMASHQAGVENAIASSGTALTEAQLKLIQRFTSKVSFAFDTDSAGEEALRRAVDIGQPLGLHMRVIRVPNGKDPADCVQQDPEVWRRAVAEAPNYLDYYLERSRREFDLSTVEGKRDASGFFLPLLKAVGSLERDHYINRFAFLLQTDPSFLYDSFKQSSKGSSASARSARRAVSVPSTGPSRGEYFVGLVLRFPRQISSRTFSIPESVFDEEVKTVYRIMAYQYSNSACVDVLALLEDVSPDVRSRLEMFMMFSEVRNAELSEELVADEIEKVVTELIRFTREVRARDLMHQIKAAQSVKDVDREQMLFQEYSQLIQS